MTSEAQTPDALLAHGGWSGTPAVTDIDDDPDGPDDGNWLVAADNNSNTEARVSFPTPSDELTAGADLQEFRAGVRQFDGGQTGTPTVRLELWEAGGLVRAGPEIDVTSATGQVISFTWNATEISAAADVECRIVGTKAGGPPTARNTVDVGAVEWVAEITIGDVIVPIDAATSAHNADPAGFSQVHDITIGGAANAHSAETGGFSQIHDVAIADASEDQTAGAAGFAQIHALGVAEAGHANSADGVQFAQAHDLPIGDVAKGQALAATSFAQDHDLAIAAAVNAHEAEATDFDQINNLAIVAGQHGHSVEYAVFSQIFNLLCDDAFTIQTVAGPDFGQVHLLAVLDAFHAHDSPGTAMSPQVIPGPPTAFLEAARAAPAAAASQGGQRIKASLS